MNNHLIFCCSARCRDHEIDDLMKTWGTTAIIKQRDNITVGNDKYLFFVDINKSLWRIQGLLIDDYRACNNYHLSQETLDYMVAWMGRRNNFGIEGRGVDLRMGPKTEPSIKKSGLVMLHEIPGVKRNRLVGNDL